MNVHTLSEVEAARTARRARKQSKRHSRNGMKPGAFTVPEQMKRDHRAIADQFALGYRLRALGKRSESQAAFDKARAMQEARRDKWYWVE